MRMRSDELAQVRPLFAKAANTPPTDWAGQQIGSSRRRNARTLRGIMSIRKDVARAVRLKEFHSRVEQLLPSADRDYFFYALKEYKTYKSVAKLMLALNSCLDTPEKLDLLPNIRELIPRHDRRKFDNLAPYNRMAHPPSPLPRPPRPPRETEEEVEGAKRQVAGGETQNTAGVKVGTVRRVFLQREKGQSLGFCIRGGREHEIGIFISQVDPFSLAERSGLAAGDKILSVNGFSFESITHQSAVLILKSHDQLQLSVATVGHVPGLPRDRKSLIWVDTSGNPVDEEKAAELTTSMEEDQRGGDRLLESPDKHKVILTVEKEQPLGFSLRGGREFSLGIFVSQVDTGSPAEGSGLKSGDQILGVNGHSFVSILHQEAVAILRAYTTLVLTVRSLGRLPQLVSEEREEVDGATPTSPAQPPHPQPVAHKTREGVDHAHKVPGPAQPDPTNSGIQTRPKRWSDWRKSVSRRSQSVRDFFRPRSLYATPPHHVHHHHHHPPPRSHSQRQQQLGLKHPREELVVTQSRLWAGSDGALMHHHKRQSATPSPSVPRTTPTSHHKTTSPLAVHSTSPIPPNVPLTVHSTSPTPPNVPLAPQTRPPKQQDIRYEEETREEGEGRGDEGGTFFRYGVGTQLMLAAVSSSARGLLQDSARRCLNEEEMEALTHRLREYERNGGVESFAEFLVSLLDTPTKMQLLSDIRSILTPTDLVTFDGIVSPHEIEALQKRRLLGNREETTPTIITTPPPHSPSSTSNMEGLQLQPNVTPAARERETPRSREAPSPGSGRERQTARGRDMERVGKSPARERKVHRSPGRGAEREDAGEGRQREAVQSRVREREAAAVEQTSRTESEAVVVYSPGRDVGEVERGGGEGGGVGSSGDVGEREEEVGRERVAGLHGVVVEEEEVEEKRLEEIAEEEEEEEEEEREAREGEDTHAEQQDGGEGRSGFEEEEEEEEEEEGEIEPVTAEDNYNLVLYEIQSHGGQGSLRRAEVREGDMGTPHIGAFGSEPASDLLTRASEEEPSMIGMQTRESFMEWNEDYDVDSLERCRRGNVGPSKNPVIIEIVKTAPQLGLTITGGVDTPSPGVIITDVKEGGAAGIDGFLQPGFEIVQVDGVRIRGLTHDAAAQSLARAFRSERPTIELIVIPT